MLGNITVILEERSKKITDDIDERVEPQRLRNAQKRENELAGSRQEQRRLSNILRNSWKNKERSWNFADAAGRLAKANQEIAQSKAEALNSIKDDVADTNSKSCK